MNPIELTRRGSDEVLAYACGKCGAILAPAKALGLGTLSLADIEQRVAACCAPPVCRLCGKPAEHWVSCNACRKEEHRAKIQKLLDDAVHVALADYDCEMVSLDPWGTEDSYLSIDDAAEDDRRWAWACDRMSWPKLDASEFLESHLDDYCEDAIDWLDVDALQKLFDGWLEAQGPGRCFQADHRRIVVLKRGAVPLLEEAMERIRP